MSESESSIGPPPDVYDEPLNSNTTIDLSSRELEIVPDLKSKYLTVLYLQNNRLTLLPDDFFPNLPNLMYLDLRDNRLTEIPKSIKDHKCLTHFLIQNNELEDLPNELGAVPNLKVLQIGGNPLVYPPKDIIKQGTSKIIDFLKEKYAESVAEESNADTEYDKSLQTPQSVNLENIEFLKRDFCWDSESKTDMTSEQHENSGLSISVNERDSDKEFSYKKTKGRCRKYNKTLHRNAMPVYYQSMKYLLPLRAVDSSVLEEKAKEAYVRDTAIRKQKDLIARRERIIQDRKNMELLKNWRHKYRMNRIFVDPEYRLKPENVPFDTLPEYMTMLTREDIEKELPDKYRKSITRRCAPSVPRKPSDLNLALKIKQLFQNLEAIEHTRQGMTPRTEQRALLTEIQKISEIKKKLSELSVTNQKNL